MPRQQRAAYNRRQVNPSQPSQPPLAVLQTFFSSGAKKVTALFSTFKQPPTASGGTATPVLMPTKPSLLRVGDATMPSNAVLSADGLSIEFTYAGANIANGEIFTLGPYDPGIRTPSGGYAAPVQLVLVID